MDRGVRHVLATLGRDDRSVDPSSEYERCSFITASGRQCSRDGYSEPGVPLRWCHQHKESYLTLLRLAIVRRSDWDDDSVAHALCCAIQNRRDHINANGPYGDAWMRRFMDSIYTQLGLADQDRSSAIRKLVEVWA